MKSAAIALSLALSVLLFSHAPLTAAELKAAVARIDLTPPLSMKAPLGGYGERMNKPAQGVHDRIFAKALVVSDGARKFALVTCDMLGLAPAFKPEVVKRLADRGWSAEQILLLPAHSHTSIEMNAINPANTFKLPQIGIHDPALYEFTVKNFVKVILDADRQLTPIRVGSMSRKIEGWNHNRRHGGTVFDNELTITRIDTAAGKPLAVLVNFTAHPTFMGSEAMLFSGDWPGHLQRTLEAAIGQGVTAMYFNGAEGDQSPIARPDSGSSAWEKAERYGRELGLLAAKDWARIATKPDVAFKYHLQTIALPERRWHPDFMATGGKEYGLSEEILREMLPRVSPAETTSAALRLGDLLIIGIPGELAAGLGIQLKAEAKALTGAQHPVIGGLANEWISYMLSPEAYREGGYESSVSFYGETLGKTICDGALAGVKNLKE
jgi:neutral ceramidase